MKKLINKIKNIKLDFSRTILILLAIVFLFLIVLSLIPQELKEQLGIVQKVDYALVAPDFDENAPQSRGDVEPEDYIDLTIKNHSIFKILPYEGFNYTVTYDHFLDEFEVKISPSSPITHEQVYQWFESFLDINSRNEITVKFVDLYDLSEPPVYIAE